MTVAITVERLALDKLHYEVGQSIFSRAAVEQAGNVWMIERCEYLTLFAEATEDEIGVHAALHQFDGGTFVELIVGARCFVNGAHAAASDFPFNPIGAEAAPDHRILIFNKRLERTQFSISVDGRVQ